MTTSCPDCKKLMTRIVAIEAQLMARIMAIEILLVSEHMTKERNLHPNRQFHTERLTGVERHHDGSDRIAGKINSKLFNVEKYSDIYKTAAELVQDMALPIYKQHKELDEENNLAFNNWKLENSELYKKAQKQFATHPQYDPRCCNTQRHRIYHEHIEYFIYPNCQPQVPWRKAPPDR